MVFDLQKLLRKNAGLRNMKRLSAAFAARVREQIKRQGVEQYLRLEQRKDVFYLVGKGEQA